MVCFTGPDSFRLILLKLNIIFPFVSVVALSIDNIKKISENRKQLFEKTIFWKFRSKITIQTKNHNFDYLIHLTFTNINILFVL